MKKTTEDNLWEIKKNIEFRVEIRCIFCWSVQFYKSGKGNLSWAQLENTNIPVHIFDNCDLFKGFI